MTIARTLLTAYMVVFVLTGCGFKSGHYEQNPSAHVVEQSNTKSDSVPGRPERR